VSQNTDVAPPAELAFATALVANVARKTPYDVYIGRSFAGRHDSGWGNPHAMRANSLKARIEAVCAYWPTIERRRDGLPDLAGNILGCWCSPRLCHGHLLAAAASPGTYEQAHAWMQSLAMQGARLPKRLLVTGSRDWNDISRIEVELSAIVERWGVHTRPVLVEGGARGADAIARDWWENHGLPVETYQADWTALGKRAGMVRNTRMVASGADGCIAFPIGESKGTRGCVKASTKAGIPVHVVEG